ncbi:MAG: Flp pilus assembly complex ATPase component TadA [Deltaproteobacteria bacterium]|nr:Flp pilus assembly complex ATPase component TadA [Deltaproteobacteria bacterium]
MAWNPGSRDGGSPGTEDPSAGAADPAVAAYLRARRRDASGEYNATPGDRPAPRGRGASAIEAPPPSAMELGIELFESSPNVAVEPSAAQPPRAPEPPAGSTGSTTLDFLRTTALFREVDAQVLTQITPHFVAQQFPAGAPIVRAGTPADGLWLLVQGRAKVLQVNAATGESQIVDRIQAGEPFGEVGALLRGAHSQTIEAEQPSITLRLELQILEWLLKSVPAVGHACARRLATRVVQLGVSGLRPAASAAAPETLAKDTIPFVTVADYSPNDSVLRMVPLRMVQQYRVLPLALRGQALTLGMVNPRDQNAIGELRRVLQSVDVRPVAIAMDDFGAALIRHKLQSTKSQKGNATISPDSLLYDMADSEREAEKEIRVIGDEVVRMVGRIIAGGLDRDASDIHVEPETSGVKVRYRVKGALVDSRDTIPVSMAKGIAARFKVLSGLDITERRLPQDGRIGLTVGNREVDLRISTIPTSRGEKIVLRVCEAASMLRALEHTFYEPTTLERLRSAIQSPGGAVIIAGGTGSGKTASLYSLLSERMKTRPDSNVIMVEDPIEYRMQGATQVQVNPTVGLGMPQVLRSIVRQDPDVIAVGEIRDEETAKLALEAAITGHLMLSSIHGSDAFSALQRFESMGATRSAVAQGIHMILVQRLVPRLCSCAKVDRPPPLLLESLARAGLVPPTATDVLIPRPVGCQLCEETGYQGRIAVTELLEIKDDVRTALLGGLDLGQVERIAREAAIFRPFGVCASFLMSKRGISGADALLAIS